jgi:spermidine synthase
VLWLRTLGWVFGVTVFAASTVWATFMAGLAAGSLGAGRLGDRVRNPLRWFGFTEILIGATALGTPAVQAALQRVYVDVYPSLPEGIGALTAVRFAIAFAVLIVPTALMGATLPLVVKASAFRSSGLREQVGILYGSNAAGAIVGTIAAGLYLIPTRGIQGSFYVAAGLNLAVGLAAVALSFVASGDENAAAAPSPRGTVRPPHEADAMADLPAARLSPHALVTILGVFTLSGVVSLALEVVWFRVLTLFVRPTVYGFAVMLATILGGIALGSYLVTPALGRRIRWMPALAIIQMAAGIAIVLSFGPLTYLNPLSERLTPMLEGWMPGYLVYPLSGSLLAIFPTALLMGLAFPVGLHLWATCGGGNQRHTAARIGTFYSMNVAGAIAGSLLAGFVLLPQLGSRTSMAVLASLTFGAGLLLLAASDLRRTVRLAAGALTSIMFVAALWRAPDPFAEFVAQRYPGQQVIWQDESVETTVVVHERSGGELSLTVNGNHEASTGGTMTYVHRRIGHLPMAIHPSAREALVIGLGGGATAGAVSIHDGVSVDIVELSAGVVRGAEFFESINYGVLKRPNVRVRVDDGRNYLMLTPKRYDVVTADVIIPIFAGSGNLYSVEYFRLMRRVLNAGGLVLQWVSGTEAEYKLITRTFLSVFPHSTAWVNGGLLVGSAEPLRLKRSDFDWKLEAPGRAQGLRDLGIESFDALLAAFTAGPDELRAFVGEGPLLTDDRPLAEYFLSLPRDREPDLTTLVGDVRPLVVDE